MLTEWTNRLREHASVAHATADLQQVQENKYYADLAGTRTTQQRVRLQPGFEAMGSDEKTGIFDSMSSIAPPVARGWEYLTDGRYDWDAELAEVPDLLAEKLVAPSVEAGSYDLVIHPSNLWLTIHESIGHATELDRALGYEANYAGTSFATYDKLGTLQYGSAIMNVTGDRTVEHGLSTVGYDDEGVQTREWDIVKDGVLVGYQLDRSMGHMKPELHEGRSNGCAYADSPGHIPIQRMANVSLQAAPDGPEHRRADRPGRARHLHRRRQVLVASTCSGSTSSSPASGSSRSPTASSTASSATSPTRRPRPSSGTPWRPSAVPRPGCSAGRSTAARPSPARSRPSATVRRRALFRDVRILNTTDEAGH